MGANLPHAFISDKDFKKSMSKDKVRTLVLQFDINMFGSAFIDLPEMLPIRRLLVNSTVFD